MELVSKAEFTIVTRASSSAWIPDLIAAAGPEVTETYIDFFTSTIRNRNTRLAYARACWQFFDWCAAHGLELTTVRPFHVAAWIEDFPGSKPTVKQKLAAVRMLYDFLVVRQITPSNNGVRRRLRLHEKGSKEHEMPVHHLLEQILNEYIVAAGLQSGQPLFQSVNSLGNSRDRPSS